VRERKEKNESVGVALTSEVFFFPPLLTPPLPKVTPSPIDATAGPPMGPAGRSPALVLLGLLLLAVSAARGSPDGGSVLRLPSSAPRHLAPRFPRSTAVDLIRALNLHPADASPRPVPADGAPAPAGTLVERPIRLAALAGEGSSVEDLGHHAGYYRLPNTHDAR